LRRVASGFFHPCKPIELIHNVVVVGLSDVFLDDR
jgi:hypothetical protein